MNVQYQNSYAIFSTVIFRNEPSLNILIALAQRTAKKNFRNVAYKNVKGIFKKEMDRLKEAEIFLGSSFMRSSNTAGIYRLNIEEQHKHNNNNDNEEEVQFHPISCEKCKQVHKHCDKKLPSCSNCVRRGLTCVYHEPKRKSSKDHNDEKKKEVTVISSNNNVISPNSSRSSKSRSSSERIQSNRFQPYPTLYPSSSSSTINSLSSSLSSVSSPHSLSAREFFDRIEEAKNNAQFSFVKQNVALTLASLRKQTHELYKIVVHPKIPIALFEQLFHSPISTLEGKALLYAIHSNIEQILGAPISRQMDLMQSTKTLLGLVSHDRSNARVMLAQYFLSICLLGHGKFKDALFYLNQMNFAVEELKSKSTGLEYEEKALVKLNELANLEVTQAIEIDQDDILSVIPFSEFFTKKYSCVGDVLEEHLPPIRTLFPPESMTKENLLIHLQTIDKVVHIVNLFFKAHSGEATMRIELDLMSYIFMRVMKILCVRTVDSLEFEILIDLCSELIEATNNKYFNILPSHVISSISVSAKEVLRTIKYFQTYDIKGLNKFKVDLFDLLQKHLNVIKKLESKYKRVEIYYSNLINDMEIVLGSKTYMESNINSNLGNVKSNFIFELSSNFESLNNSYSENNDDLFDTTEVDLLLQELTEQR